MYRPAPIGLSVVQFKQVKKVGKSLRIYVTGADLLHGTPILDIKPYIQYSDAVPHAQSGYAQDEPIRKTVIWMDTAEAQKKSVTQRWRIATSNCAGFGTGLGFRPTTCISG